MGRRSKAESLGIVERIIDLYTRDKLKSDDIAKELEKEGIKLSSRSIRRTIRTNKEAAVQLRKAQEETEILLDSIKDTAGTDLVDAANQLVARKLVDYIKDLDDLDFDDPKDLFSALSAVTSGTVGIGRLKMEFTRGVKAAKADLKKELTKMLAESDPELLIRLVDAIESIDVEYKRGRGV